MVGITSYGGYIPKLRLNRSLIFQAMGWFAPAIMAVAQGERSVCNWDEDALSMGVSSSQDCLRGGNKKAVDAFFLCSTTLPYLDRQNAAIVKEALNLRDDVQVSDATGSLKAGTSALITALDMVKADAKKKVLVTATDHRQTKGAYFYEMWFGDGAGSFLVGAEEVIAEYKGSYSVTHDFVDHFRGDGFKYDYMWEERWVREEGYAKFIPEVISGLLQKTGLTPQNISKLIFPCFFKREHASIAQAMGFQKDQLVDNMHEVCGETGTAHPFIMFISALENAKPGDNIIVAGFGQGSDALLFEVTENISKLSPRNGVKGSLANKRKMTSYMKYLKFRDLMKVEMGIRAEGGANTSQTVLWRKHKGITGIVGGKCTKCGTQQYPKNPICVKCDSIHTQEDFEFADIPAKIIMYTADLLAISWEPPSPYGLVQFEGGGRILLDFTDVDVDIMKCQAKDVEVGQEITLSFRKRYYDDERGFTGYFWKGVPVIKKEEGGK